MFKKLQLKTMALLALLLIGAGSAWGETSTLTFTKACGGSGTADDGAVWTVTSDGAESNFDATYGIHYGTNKAEVTYLQLSTSAISGTITKVVVNARDAQATATISVTVGGTAFTCSGSSTATNASADYTFTGSGSGEIIVKVDRGSSLTKAIYVKSIAVTYTAGGAGDTRTDIATIGDLGVTSLPYNADGTFTVDVTPADPSLVNHTDYELSWSSSDDDIIAVDAQSGEYLVGNTKGTVTITATVTALDDETYKDVTKDFEITVYDPNANDGTLAKPFTVAEAIEATPAIGTSEEYYIKGIVCSFEKASIIADGTNYRYYISDDGSTANKLLVYKGKGLNQVAFANADDLMVGDKVVIYGGLTTYNSTKEVASGNYIVSLKRQAAVTLSFSETEVTLKKGDAFVAPTFTKTPADLEGVVFASSNSAVATVSNAGLITLGGATGTAVITATFAETDEYKGAEASVTITVNDGDPIVEPAAGKYVKVTKTEDITDGQYLIVNETASVAFDGSLATLDGANDVIDVEINNENQIAETTATKAAEFTLDVTNGTIKSASGYYIGVSANSNGLKQTTEASTYTNSFTIDDSGNAVISAVFDASNMTLRYNKASNQNRFRYYGSGQEAIQLYKYVAGESVDKIDIAVSSAGFATYVSNFDLDYSDVKGLFAYKAHVSDGKIIFTKVDKVPAGEGVLLRATNGATKFTVPTTTSADELGDNLFVRGTGAAVDSEADGKKNYILNIVDDKIGFYRAAGQTVATNRAYLSTTVSTARIALSFDDETTGIATVENASVLNENYYNLNGQRIVAPQKGLYIVNGKKVVLK